MISMSTATNTTQAAFEPVQTISTSTANQASESSEMIAVDNKKKKDELTKQLAAAQCRINELKRARENPQLSTPQMDFNQVRSYSFSNQVRFQEFRRTFR